jgi:hypothetical protein
MDALSDVLRVVRLKGGVFLHAEFTAPWCISSKVSPGDCGPLLEGAEHIVLCHYVVEGRLTAQIPNGTPVEIEAGEVAILPHNHGHLLGSRLDLPPVPARETVLAKLSELLFVEALRRHAGARGRAPAYITAMLSVNRRASPAASRS